MERTPNISNVNKENLNRWNSDGLVPESWGSGVGVGEESCVLSYNEETLSSSHHKKP